MSENEDDDWFERALHEESEADETEAADELNETETPGEATAEAEADENGTGETQTGDGAAGEAATDESAGLPEEPADESTPGESEDSPFAGDFASELENAPSPESGEEGQPSPEPGAGSAPGDFASEEPGGFGGTDEFGGGGDEFGFGDFGGGGGPGEAGAPPGGPESFETESFESDIDRLTLGIEGLDEMILGGVPERSLIVAMGSAGTGKTTFGLQFLYEGLQNDESVVYITLEESRERIINTADEKGWEFSRYEDEGKLAVVDLDPIEMANSLSSIQSELPDLIHEFDAERLVLDSVSLLEMMYDNPARRRSEVFEFAKSLKDAGVTTFVTSEASEESSYTSRYGIIEYLADAVFVLQYVRPSDFQETRLAVEIQKIRDANHSRETKPYEITDEGISVYRQANIF